jgi:hypothetical protein
MFLIAAFWETVILLVIWVPLVLLWLSALLDLLLRQRMSGIARVLWLLVIILIPVIGALIYFLVRSRDVLDVVTAPDLPGSVPEVGRQLQTLTELRDSGALSEEEFAKAKAKLLG